jgi:hypothetical protein
LGVKERKKLLDDLLHVVAMKMLGERHSTSAKPSSELENLLWELSLV